MIISGKSFQRHYYYWKEYPFIYSRSNFYVRRRLWTIAWEGPYVVELVYEGGAYQLIDEKGICRKNTLIYENLKGCYIHEVKAPRPKVSLGVYTNYIKAIRHRDKKRRKPFSCGWYRDTSMANPWGCYSYSVRCWWWVGEKITPYTPVTTYCSRIRDRRRKV